MQLLSPKSPSQDLTLCSTADSGADLLILLTDLRIACQLLFCWPDFPTLGLFTVKVLCNDLANCALEEDGCLLKFGVELTIDENVSIQVQLLVVAKNFVFAHDAGVHLANELKIGVRGVSVTVDFVCHLGAIGTAGEEFLDHYEMWSINRDQTVS